MKNKLKRILSTLLVLALLVPTVAYAANEDGGAGGGGGATGSDSWGSTGGGYIIGLGRCEWESYTGASGDIDALYDWIATYACKYYEKVQGKAYYLNEDRSPCSSLASGAQLLGTSGDPLGILQEVSSGGGGTYTYKTAQGSLAIYKEKVPEVMEALKDCNPALYRQYCDNPFGEDGHPVVIIIEAVGNMSDGKGYTVADLGTRAGADIYGKNFQGAETLTCMSWGYGGPTVSSATGAYIWNSLKSTTLDANLTGRLFKSMFGVNRRGNIGAGENGYHGYADYAGDGPNHEITGCYIISCGGMPLDGSTQINFLHGVYEWDFDSVNIPVNERSHEEDGYAEISKGASVNGKFDFGFVNLKNSSAPAWKQYGQTYQGQSVDLELKVYGLGTGNGANEYSVDSNTLKSKGDANASGVISGLQATYTKSGVPWDTFVGYLENGTPQGFQFDGMSGGSVKTTISASASSGMVAVGYYTELYVTPHAGGPQGGQKIQFVCPMVHYAVYTPKDDTRTYKLYQTGLQGWSQLKDNAIGSAVFEAQAGTPTTEDMFISMGGSEYIVNMQYALHVDDYKRTYDVKVPEFANYMYYHTGDNPGISVESTVPSSYQGDPIKQDLHGSGDRAYNNTDHGALGRTTNNRNQQNLFKQQADEFYQQVNTLLTELDENATQSANHDYDENTEYAVIVTKGITIDSGTWKLKDIDTHVFGADASLVAETKKKLEWLSKDLEKIKRKYDNITSLNAYDSFDSFNSSLSYLPAGINITFCKTVDGKNDFDSAAKGYVKILFQFMTDNKDRYTWPDTKYYDHGSDINIPSQSATHDNSHSHGTLKTENHSTSEVATKLAGNTYDRHDEKSCSTQVEDGTNEDGSTKYKDCGDHNCSDKGCKGKTHSHYNHKSNGSYIGTAGSEEVWTVDNDCDKEHNYYEYWGAAVKSGIEITYSEYNGYPAFTNRDDNERGKNLSYNHTLEQIYKSVKYMDIVDCHVWRLAGGVADGDGLTDLMCAETDVQAITPVIEMACNNLGYTLYNTAPVEQQDTFARTYTTADGTTYNQVWTAVDKEFAEAIEIDESIDEEPEWSANTELSAIGRLANSYNPGSSEAHQPFSTGADSDEHGFKITGEGDALTFTYDIEEQGGWSHWSFDGMLKQALAIAFYESEDPGTAYRNYVLVQSDYLSLGEQPLTMSGMQWASKTFDKDAGAGSTGGEFGLTQAILNSGTYMDAADIARYYPTGEPWKHYSFDESATANTTQTHIAGSDISVGSGGEDEVLGDSSPSDKTSPLGMYAEGPEELEGEYADANSGKDKMFVRLDKDPEYGAWNVDTMVSNTLSGAAGINANFDTEGKEGSGGNSLNFSGNVLPTVGYVGAEDSVIEDKHVYAPAGGGSTAFNPMQTFASGGFAGLTFDMYGNPNAASHLYTDTGATAAGTKVVSAKGNTNVNNRVINKGLMFPYVTGLNVVRWKPNNVYGGYETALVYDECLHFYEARPGVISSEETTKDKLQLKGGAFGDTTTTSEILSDLKQHGAFDDILAGDSSGLGGSGGIITGVSYGGATKSSPGNTNSVTIFNPSPAENVKIIPMSEQVPDGQNNPKDHDNFDSGYGERDQRVSENVAGSSGQETYVFYGDYDSTNLTLKNLQSKFKLKNKTDYNGGITEYYTLDDFINVDRSAQTWTLSPTQESFNVTKTGNYTLSLFDTTDKDTSVQLKLNAGDSVSTDGTSVYLSRGEDSAPLVTWDSLANSVAKYYLLVDNLTSAGQSAMQSSLITNFVSNNQSILDSIRRRKNTLNYTWSPDTVTYQSELFEEALEEVNKCIQEYNDSLSSIALSYLSQPYVWYEDGVLTIPDVVDQSLLIGMNDEYEEMVSAVEQRATELGVTINVTRPLEVVVREISEEPYMEQQGEDFILNTSRMQGEIHEIQNAYIAFLQPVYQDVTRQESYSSARLKLQSTYEYPPTGQNEQSSFENLVDEFIQFSNLISANFEVSGGDVQLHYAGNFEALEQFLFDMQNLREELLSVAQRNGLETVIPEVPGVILAATDGRASTFKHDDRFDVDAGGVMTMDFTGLGMSKGSTLVVRIPYDKAYSDPADVTLSTDGNMLDFQSVVSGLRNTAGYDYTLYKYSDGNDWVYVIEALDDVRLGTMTMKFNQNASIMQFAGSCVDFDKIWLCDVGSAYSNPVYLGTTIEHNHYAAGNIYWNKATRTRSVNKVLFDSTSVKANINVTIKSATLYISKESDSSMILSPDALDNPHKVYNANWRYYVLGWETDNGSKIMSPDDSRLFVDTTVLKWPNAASGTITVGELRNTACLVKVGCNVYLTTKAAGLEHKILQTGIQVSKYDYWTLGGSVRIEKDIVSQSGTFPLAANVPAKGIGGNTDGELAYQDAKYEFFFQLLDEDAPLFNVEYSRNYEYRFSSSTLHEFVSGTADWTWDWDKEEVNAGANVTIVPGRPASAATSEYISLDDEFEVYFDNVGGFTGNASSYNEHVDGPNSGKLGYGWNANGIKLLGSDVEKGIGSWYGGGDDGVGEDEYVEDDNIVTRETTECTGWIYAKYLTFSIDVYVFMDDNGKINPIVGAYDKDGNRRKAVLVPAGSPVYLGEYVTGHSVDSDNTGGFLDYGNPEAAAAADTEPFTYKFWCPLYNGEANNTVKVEFHSVNINDDHAAGNPSGNLNTYLVSGGDKGIGGNAYVRQTPTNRNDAIANDNRHSNNEVTTSIVGRIGALTIADTGDPRYSDSFKATDLSNTDADNFLIYPIVRKVLQYSNEFTGRYTAVSGSQRGIVLDPFDVRGRLCTEWMVNYAKEHHTDESGNLDWTSIDYKLYESKSYDTYGTQWYKHTITQYARESSTDSNSVQWAQALPLTPNFNKHDTFKNKPMRVGYEVYCSVESIGNYFGDATGSADPDDEDGITNGNNDYGQNKVQVRPFYAAIDAVDGKGDAYEGPVDVYMRAGDTYVMINSGCDKTNSADVGTVCNIPEHSMSELLAVLYSNFDPNYIETNTGEKTDSTFLLDENMKRRMVTNDEAKVTFDVLESSNGRKSILTKTDKSTGGIGGQELEIRYTYGCSQLLFLRERNMTYVGGRTAALNYDNPIPTASEYDNRRFAQKWYFGLGLPSSAVFVPHGLELNLDNVLKTGYVVNSIDVIIHGEIWTLHYESEVSKMTFDYEEGSWSYKEWNPWYEKYPYLIPVTYYNIGDTSTADLDTQGSH